MGEATLLLSEPLSLNQDWLQTNSIAEYRFNKGNLLPGDMQNDHPFLGRQGHFAMPGTAITSLWFLLRVDSSAEIVPAAAPFDKCKARDLGDQFDLSLFGQNFPKLNGKRGSTRARSSPSSFCRVMCKNIGEAESKTESNLHGFWQPFGWLNGAESAC